METKQSEKLNYCTPIIECIQLDNEISLALESNPPFGPNEIVSNSNYQDPFKLNNC